MQLSIIQTRAHAGISSVPVQVEIHLANGLPVFNIVGLPETAVKESKDRVRSAIVNSQFEFPLKRITVNLAPADLPKEGGRFDLPIAIGILVASQQISAKQLDQYEFAGELALSGALRPFKGVLPFALATLKHQKALFIPQENAHEASLAGDLTLYPANSLAEVGAHLNNKAPLQAYRRNLELETSPASELDLQEIYGQPHAKRALEIAASGNHSLLMSGPPGSGKTMLASRLPSISPPLTQVESLEIAAVYSISRFGFSMKQWQQRPFRAPHHTSSGVALVGGGRNPQPGEISLAHHGVLFLDELPEFNRHVLEVLREPLEAGTITISRANNQAEFPAQFQLVAAMNPCPCGYLGSPNHDCRCSPAQIERYRTKLSGPFLDRIDLHIEVPALPTEKLLFSHSSQQESSKDIQSRVIAARQLQYTRNGCTNNQLNNKQIEKFCALQPELKRFVLEAIEKLNLSARAYHRILKVARTLADLEQATHIEEAHMIEAISYRKFEQKVSYT